MKTTVKLLSLVGHTSGIDSICLLPNGNLVSGSSDGTIKIWDLFTGSEITTLKDEEAGNVHFVLSLPNERLVSGHMDDVLKIWNLKTGEHKTLSGHTNSVKYISVLPNGNIVSGSADKTIKIWDIESGNCVKTLHGHSGTVDCLLMLQNGNIVSGSYDKSIRLWDLQSEKCIKTLLTQSGVCCMLLLPNGNVLSGLSDNTLKIWNIETGECVKTLSGHTGIVNCVLLLPNGNVLSGSGDNTLKIWDIESAKCIKTITEHGSYVHCILLLPNGKIASGSGDKTIKIYDLSDLEKKDSSNEKVSNDLSDLEKKVSKSKEASLDSLKDSNFDGKPMEIYNEFQSIVKGVLENPESLPYRNALENALFYFKNSPQLMEKIVKTKHITQPNHFIKWLCSYCVQIYERYVRNTHITKRTENGSFGIPLINNKSTLFEEYSNNIKKYNIDQRETEKIDQGIIDKHEDKASDDEKLSVVMYEYSPTINIIVNKLLHEGEQKISDWILYIKNLTRTTILFSTPEKKLVFRGQREIPGDIESWKVGDIKFWPGFECASTSSSIAKPFAKEGVLFTIHLPGGYGVMMSKLSNSDFADQSEILLPPYSTFSVMKAKKLDGMDIVWEVELECLGYQPMFQAHLTQKEQFNFDILHKSIWDSKPDIFFQNCSTLNKLNIDTVDSENRTLLYLAARNGLTEVVKWLVDHGASVNAICYKTSSTALHVSSYYEKKGVVHILLKAGIREDIINSHGYKAIQEVENQEIIQLIMQYSSPLKSIEDCIKREICTYTLTGANETKQFITFCKTCDLIPYNITTSDGKNLKCYRGFCDGCKSCHEGHETYGRHETEAFWCDCIDIKCKSKKI